MKHQTSGSLLRCLASVFLITSKDLRTHLGTHELTSVFMLPILSFNIPSWERLLTEAAREDKVPVSTCDAPCASISA